MDGYDPAYVAHNLPYLVVSGLGQLAREPSRKDGGARISSDIPPVESEDATNLLKHFKDSDATNLAWNGREHSGRNKFRVRTIGRDYILPPRHASPLAATVGTTPNSRPVLHSALSPLSPGSAVFPDGYIDSKWIDKHQDRVPSAFVSFYNFTSDAKLSTLNDNQLKTAINNIKKVLTESGYKSRLIVALLSEKSIVQSPDIEERLANIRKATGLDSKTSLFFLPPQSSPVELKAFVDTILSTTYPLSIEYYRELSKHARRKRNRGIVPPPTALPATGSSATLSSQGWNVRYDFKLGVFAEFRQEMDSALRSFESGYGLLLGPDVLEAVANWNPRWNEGRLLADVFAIRILRCHLWAGNSTVAVRWWHQHRERILDFVDRRGKGSATYGWQAWEARWATVMGEVITKASFPEFATLTIYLPADKTIPTGDRIKPSEHLHHPGYWYRVASTHISARQALAKAIPEEDRSPPGSSPASQIASKAYMYDTYLCPEPHEESPLPGSKGVDHSELLIQIWSKATKEFKQRKQHRLAQELQLAIAREHMKQEAWDDALQVLRPLWLKMSFRQEGWWNAVEEVGWALRKVATKTGDGISILSVDWELMNQNFTHHKTWHYDLAKSLQGVENITTKPAVVLNNRAIHSFLSASYSFEYAEGKVGETASSQFAIISTAIPGSAPITMSEVRIEFEGSMKPLLLKHQRSPQEAGKALLQKIVVTETTHAGRPSLEGHADLTFPSDQTRVLEFDFVPREAGDAKAVAATFSTSAELFDLEYVHTFEKTNLPDLWWGKKAVEKKLLRPIGQSPSSINILPKPPKMELDFSDLKEQYYTNEPIILRVKVTNDEDENSIARLQVLLLGDGAPEISTRLLNPSETDSASSDDEDTPLSGLLLGKISAKATTTVLVHIPPIPLPTIYDLSLKTTYNLTSDLETPIYRSTSLKLEITTPFEANYDFSPRIHPDPWPSFFTHDESTPTFISEDKEATPSPQGLAQRWTLTARYFSFATSPLLISSISLAFLSSTGNIHSISKSLTPVPSPNLIIEPKTLQDASFEISTQKLSLDDRGGATMDVGLVIKWRRPDTNSTSKNEIDSGTKTWNTTTLGVPRLNITSTEPRVLTSLTYSPLSQPSSSTILLTLRLHLENPSSHFLTFALSLEPSTLFAFSGPKQTTVQLVPYSRREVVYRLIPYKRGDWVGPVGVVVKDRYFQKVLRVLGDEGLGVRGEKEGLFMWVPPEEDEDEREDAEKEEGDES